MSDERTLSYCVECKQPLTEIDKVRLSEEDLRALHQLRREK